MSVRKIVIAGATGTLGPSILSALSSSPANYTISILTRTTSANTSTTTSTSPALPSSIHVLKTDYTFPSLTALLTGQDALISTLGAPATLLQLTLIDAAIAAGVRVFLPSDYAPYTPDLSEIESVVPDLGVRLRPKKAVLDYLEKKAKEIEGVDQEFMWSAVGSGPLFDWTLKTGFLGTSLPLRTATIIDSGNTRYLTTTTAQIGRAILSVLTHYNDASKSQLVKNKYLLVSSFATTQNEVLASCERVTGQKFVVEKVTAAERGREGKEMLGRGDFRGIGRLWNVWGHADVEGGNAREILTRELADEVLGLEREDMDAVVKRLL